MIASSTFMINPSLYGKVPYDPIKDFDPVTIAATTPNVLVAHTSVPATNVKELVELIRSGKYSNYATPGAGTPSHLSGELFRAALKLEPDRGPVPRRRPDDSIRPRRPHADRLFIAATRRAPAP
jgi:tripartite-type tricarboxylate transporter receptor subunit TctC